MMKKKQIIILAIIILFFAAYLADRNEEKEADRNKEPDVTVAGTSETTTELLQNTDESADKTDIADTLTTEKSEEITIESGTENTNEKVTTESSTDGSTQNSAESSIEDDTGVNTELVEDEPGRLILSDIPPYLAEPYVEINNNIPFFTSEEKSVTDSFEKYSELDSLGRCGVAYAH